MIYKATGELEEHLARQGLAREHEIDDRGHAEMMAKLRLSPSHATESADELHHRAAYALIWKNHLQRRRASLEERLTALEADVKRNYWLLAAIGVLVLFLLAVAARAQAQDSVVIRGASKGTTTAAPVTATANGANHTGLDVNVLNAGSGGTASGFGSAFPATGTAGGFKDNNGNMAGANLDSSGNLFVNCASGCSAVGDTVGAAQTLAALNNSAAVALAGERSASFVLPAGNTLVATLTPEASFDGGVTWAATFLRQDGQNAWQATLGASSTSGAFHALVPGGASNIRIRVSSYTSGSAASVTMRAVAQPEALPGWAGILGLVGSPQWVQVAGSDGANDRALKTDTSGDLSVVFPSAQPISAASLPLPAGAATDTTLANPQFSAGTTTAPGKVLLVGGKTSDATPQYQPLPLTNGGAAIKTDASATTQPVSGTVSANQGTSPWVVAGNVASASSDSGNPMKTGGVFNTTLPTVTSGQRVDQQMSNRGEALIAKGPSGFSIDNTGFNVNNSPTVVQGNKGSNAQAWWTEIGDTSNGPVAVKAASTAAAAADPALVIAFSPNSPLPAGSNLVGKAGFDSTTPGTTNGVTMYQVARTTGTITSATSTVSVGVIGYGVATVTVNGTYAGVTINFEFSDDNATTWYTETCTRTDAAIQESSEALPSNQTRAWDCGVYAATNFRVRASAYTSGTANIGLTLSAAPVEPAATVSAGSLPLPTNAAQETGGNLATLAGGITSGVYQTNIKQIGGTAVVADPCQANTKSFVSINQTANTRLVAGTASKKIFPCSVHLVTAAAQNIALVEGTGTTCGTGTAGVQGFGGATAATGWNLAANGGLTYGNGASALGAEGTAADDMCLFQSGTGQVSGGLSYVIQ